MPHTVSSRRDWENHEAIGRHRERPRACFFTFATEEAALSGHPVIFGPNMQNFRAIAGQFTDEGACLQVQDAGQLRHAVQELLEDTDRREAIVAAAHRVIQSNVGATQRCVALIAEQLSKTHAGITSLSVAG